MTGSIRKKTLRNGAVRWQARYRTPNGKQRAQNFERRAEAQRWLARAEVGKADATWVDPRLGRVTFSDWWEHYDTNLARHRRDTTAARDRVVVERHLLPTLGNRALSSITPSDIQQVVWNMEGAKLGPATVRTNYGVLRAVLAAAVNAEKIPRTPCRNIHLPAQHRPDIKFLSTNQLADLADAMPVEYRPMVYLAGVLGLRWSEVAGLRVGRIDFLRRTLTVAETLAEVGGHLIFAEVKTDASRRTLPVPPTVLTLLSEHLARRGSRPMTAMRSCS